MRISHRYKFVYVSKPKCASESIRKSLNPYSDIYSSPDNSSPYYHHTNLKQLQQHFSEQGWQFDDYFKFTSVRNPWEMAVSLYSYAKTDINGIRFWDNSTAYEPQKLISFEDWLRRGALTDFFTLENFILDENQENLCDHIVKVENLSEDLLFVSNKLGIDLKVSRTNRSMHSHYSEYYDSDDLIQIVKDIFAYEISLGNYCFSRLSTADRVLHN